MATGTVYWGQDYGGLNLFDPTTDSFITYQYDPADSTSLWTNAVQGVLEDREGNFWVATTAGLQKMDRERGQFEHMRSPNGQPFAPGTGILDKPSAYSLLEDQSGGLWVGTIGNYKHESHLVRFDPKDNTPEFFPIKSAAWNLLESRDGTIWVAPAGEGGNQIYKIKPKSPTYQLAKGDHLFSDFKKAPLFKVLNASQLADKWYGPLAAGFDPNDGSMWLSYFYEVRGKEDGPYAILVNYSQGTGKASYYWMQDLDLHGMKSDTYLGKGNRYWSPSGLVIEGDGKVWGTYPSDSVGVYCFNVNRNTVNNYIHNSVDTTSLLSNHVTWVMQDQSGMIWAAQPEQGLSRLNPNTGAWVHYTTNAPESRRLPGNEVLTAFEDEQGRIWTGGNSKAKEPFITSIDLKAGTTENHPCPAGLASYNFPRIFAQTPGHLLFTLHAQGLGTLSFADPYAPGKVYNPFENNFPIEHISTMVVDGNNIAWLASIEENRFVRFDLQREDWTVFKSEIQEPAVARRGEIGPNGHLYFLLLNQGWLEIDPEKVVTPTQERSQLRLTEVWLKDKRLIPGQTSWLQDPIWEVKQLDIRQEEMPLSLQASAFHYLSSTVLYQYRLFPYETNWKTVAGAPAFNYTYLPAGKYELQVKGFTEMGVSNNSGTLLKLTIWPPWWRSWWAFLLYSLGLLAIIVGIYYYQQQRWSMRLRLQKERQKAERLQEMNQFKSRFYTNFTHEFRTPLTIIRGTTEQIQGHEKIKGLIYQNCEQLLRIVSQVLDLSKLESNNLPISWGQANIIPFLRYLTESFHSQADREKLNLAFFSKEEELVMDFDEVKIRQILENLISNAIKFTPEYGSVKVIAARIQEGKKEWLELKVKDTGSGIPSDKLPYIFDRFYQVDDSSMLLGEGTGIGLALVKELVAILEGRIQVESEIGRGTSFVLHLPVHQDAVINEFMPPLSPEISTEGDREQAEVPPLVPDSEDKTRILVIEDNVDVSDYIISVLPSSYIPTAVRTGEEGLQKAIDSSPDVIICDVMMPEIDGFEVCRRLRNDVRTAHIPIILLTAKATRQAKLKGLSVGADAYLTKPFDKEELLLRLTNLSRHSQQFLERLRRTHLRQGRQSAKDKEDAAFLEALHENIESNLGNESFQTQDLCRAMGMSRSKLHRKLTALKGESTASYVRTIRMEKARFLLETTKIPVGDIALQVGFKDFSHFSRTFKQKFGFNPSDTRK